MPAPPYLLLPPSEGKAPGGRTPRATGQFDDALRAPRDAVLAELEDLLRRGDPEEQSKVFKARGELAQRAAAATAGLVARSAPVLPAWKRYSGVVWGGLDPDTLAPTERKRLLVPSGLYGITNGTDPVADYRLTMLVSLGGLGNLAAFWRPHVTEVVAAKVGRRTVIDLLPVEHAQAIDRRRLAERATVVEVRFVDEAGSRAIGHMAKEAKGRLARLLIDEGVEAGAHFAWDGWRTEVNGERWRVVAPRSAHTIVK